MVIIQITTLIKRFTNLAAKNKYSLIDVFIANSDDVDTDYIVDFIGDATVIG